MKRLLTVVIALSLLSGCFRNGERDPDPSLHQDSSYTRYATRYDVAGEEGYRVLRVFNPWQNSRDITYSYVLGTDRGLVPDSLAVFPFIKIPTGAWFPIHWQFFHLLKSL